MWREREFESDASDNTVAREEREEIRGTSGVVVLIFKFFASSAQNSLGDDAWCSSSDLLVFLS